MDWGCYWNRKKRDDARNDEIPKRLGIKTILSERERMAGQRFVGRRRGVQ